MSSASPYSIRAYGVMVDDQRRTAPYVEALRQAVTPGSVVLDIGTGSGIFSFLACRFGAARVYALETDDVIDVARLCVADNPGAERITWLRGLSTALSLPEPVDVVIADLHGTLPFYNRNIESLLDARRRHLRPGGTLLPGRDLLRVVPAQASGEYRTVACPWQENDYGVDFSAAAGFVRNSWWRASNDAVAADNLLADPGLWGVIDYTRSESADLDGEIDWRIDKAGTCHGYYVWFDTEFDSGPGPSNAPHLPGIAYGRAFFPLEREVVVAPGDRLRARFQAKLVHGEHVYRWRSHFSSAAGRALAQFDQSTFADRPLRPDDLRRSASDHVPTLSLDGQLDCAILQALSKSQPLGGIARDVLARFPARFDSVAAALGHVSGLALRYTT